MLVTERELAQLYAMAWSQGFATGGATICVADPKDPAKRTPIMLLYTHAGDPHSVCGSVRFNSAEKFR